MEQQDGETVAQFVTRLKKVVKDFDYGDQSDNQIRDQVAQRCKSHALRRKLLEKGENLTLALLLKTAATYEAVQSQLASMEGGQHTVNLIRDSRREAEQRKRTRQGVKRGVLQVWQCRTLWSLSQLSGQRKDLQEVRRC